jgi:hypothetical protein
MTNYQIFLGYRNLGYQIIPLHYGSKSPILANWNQNYDHDIMDIYFKNCHSQINFGILLGDIVDVEGDSKYANDYLTDLLGKINHPIYQSSKSLHHLFRNPHSNLTRVACDGIELRAYKHQSVIPPSTHGNGIKYKWLTKLMRVEDIPWLPESLHEQIRRAKKIAYKKKYKNKCKPRHVEPRCNTCKKSFFMHQKRFVSELECFKELNELWKCKNCRKFDLRQLIKFNKKIKSSSYRNCLPDGN